VNGGIQPLIGAHFEPRALARQQLVELWDNLSVHGRKAVLTAARLVAHEEGVLRAETLFVASDEEVT
jgi:hypothetical protein